LKEIKQFNSEEVDSTGLALWPSEELLAYFLYRNLPRLSNAKRIIELGAGFSGLASLLLAKLFQEELSLQGQ